MDGKMIRKSKQKKRPQVHGRMGASSQAKLYSNSSVTQRERILKAFESKKQMSTFYMRDILGIVHPAGRIKELRQFHKIPKDWTHEPDHNGKMHRIALYAYQGLATHRGGANNV